MDLKDKCYETRHVFGLSQSAFAKVIGTNQTEISFIERGFIPKQKQIDMIELLYFRVRGKNGTNQSRK